MSELCAGRVAIITGAGSGLGRAYALALAAAGAKVVVNDINRDAAKATVEAIRNAGGEAISNDSDITDFSDSARAVQETLNAFGGLHAVVNNAGVCRDRMFVSLSEEEWDAVMAVHLKGHFCITRHACSYWRGLSKQGETPVARIINTSSGAGLQGSVGQSNYSAAKGGIASLTLVQAAELKRYGVTANALAPAARTGMTEEVFAERMAVPEEGFDYFDPANVAPLVVWLVSEDSSAVSGCVFEAEGDMLSLSDGWRRGPVRHRGDRRWAAEEVGPAVAEMLAEAVPPQPVYGAA
jgi:NAD(P)-dependent dehydrogenase (short-subunit alcohol dehydrogenase family)